MLKQYKYKVRLICEYSNGRWYFCDPHKWKIWKSISSKNVEIKFSENITWLLENNNYKTLSKVLREIDVSIPPQSPPCHFLKWLTLQNNKHQADNGQTVVLNNFILSNKRYAEYTILSSIVGKNMTVQIYGLQPIEACWFFFNFAAKDVWVNLIEEYTLMFPELFFKIDKTFKPLAIERINVLKKTIKLLKSHRIQKTLKILGLDYNKYDTGLKITLEIENSILTPYHKGRVCG